MDFKLFNDLYDTLKKVLGDIKTVADIPAEERNHYRIIISDTLSMLDTTLLMVIMRLADIQMKRESNPQEFLYETQRLSSLHEWAQVERGFRLCSNLRATHNEMYKVRDKLVGKYSVHNWDELTGRINGILGTETELAGYICREFDTLSVKAGSVLPGSKEYQSLVAELGTFKDTLILERRQLIQTEAELYDAVI